MRLEWQAANGVRAMAKKKALKKGAAAGKSAAAKKAVVKKAGVKKGAGRSAVTSKAPVKKTSSKSAAGKKKAAKAPALGRPTITVEEKLFMLFHDDYHARQIFEFLRADTVGDLEKFSPQEIIHRLSRPIRETVDRIRMKLAERNRCLAGDEQFAVENRAKSDG